jgi:hypothetical protein
MLKSPIAASAGVPTDVLGRGGDSSSELTCVQKPNHGKAGDQWDVRWPRVTAEARLVAPCATLAEPAGPTAWEGATDHSQHSRLAQQARRHTA